MGCLEKERWEIRQQVKIYLGKLRLCCSATDSPEFFYLELFLCMYAKPLQLCHLCDPMDYIACQAPLSMVFPRQEYWSGLTWPSSGNLPKPGIEPTSPVPLALQMDSLPLSHLRNTWNQKRLQITRAISRKNKVGGITLPNFTLCYKAIAIKTACCWQENRHIDQKKQMQKPTPKSTRIWSTDIW